jgi:hypothetical protein
MKSLSKDLQQMVENGWFCGFVDGEGSFCIHIQKYGPNKERICLRPSFSIAQHKQSKYVLDKIKNNFGFGKVIRRSIDGHFMYQVTSLKDSMSLIDFFDSNDFLNIKKNDYELWKKCVVMLKNGEHRDYDGLIEILKIRQKLNENTKSKRRITLNDINKLIGKAYSKRSYLNGNNKEKIAKFKLNAYKNKKIVNLKKYELSDKFETKRSLNKCLKLYKLVYPDLDFKIEDIDSKM